MIRARARNRWRSRCVIITAPILFLSAIVGATATGPRKAVALETDVPSVNQDYVLSGHGFGHGRGMSQWGAYGMATQGYTAQQILDFYYPGTLTTTLSTNPLVHVWLTKDEGVDVEIVAGLGNESVTDATTGAALALPAAINGVPVTDWKAARVGGGPTQLFVLSQGSWQPYPATGQLSTNDTLRFTSDSGVVRLVYPDQTQRAYQGSLDAVQAGTVIRTVNTLPMEDYLKGVVPHEAINWWPAAALQAQAVAARTYAAARLGGAVDDICDSTACQVYLGLASYDVNGTLLTNLQYPESDAAIAAVAGQVRTNNGVPVSTEYSSSDGGWTVGGGVPWEPAQADPYDAASPDHNWTQTVTSAGINTAYPSIGSFLSFTINQRDGNGDWGGRILSMTLNGTLGSETVTGAAFSGALGLKSDYWTVGSVATAPSASGYLHPLQPARILDTRLAGGAFGAGETRSVPVAGLGGVPADAVGVVLNVTATDTSTSSFVTVWPDSAPRPNTSNLNWDRGGQTVANLVLTGVGSDGAVQIYNNAGSASIIVDVSGYYEPTSVAGGLGFVPVTPARVLDTRVAGDTPSPIAGGTSRSVTIAGTDGIDPNAQAVLVNLTGTNPTANTYLTLWPAGVSQPGTSNLNLLPKQTRANAAIDLLGGGALSVYNNLGNTDAIIDVLGQYLPGDGSTGDFVGMQPTRLLDTRASTGAHPGAMAAGETFALPVLGQGGLPATGVSAVVLNITAVAPTVQTYITAWPSGLVRPATSNLNAAPGTVVPNLAITGVGSDGTVDLYNDAGSTNLVVDVVGWIAG